MTATLLAEPVSESRLRRPWEAVSILALFVSALLVRFLLLASVTPRPQKLYFPDSFSYDQIALNLLYHGTFSSQVEAPFTADLKRTPGYPSFMAAVYAFAGHFPEAVVLAQLILAAATVVLVYFLSRELGLSWRGALLAAAVLAVEPVSSMTSVLLLSETLFTFLLILSLLTALRWRGSGAFWLAAAGVGLGLASLTRPVAQLLPLVVVPLLFARAQRDKSRMAVAIVIFLVLSLGITFSWAYQNYRTSGQFTLSTVGEVNLIYYRAREVLAEVKGISQGDALKELQDRVSKSGSPAEKAIAERAEAIGILLDHPTATIAMTAKGAARTFADPGFTPICTLLNPANNSMECFPGQASMNEPGVIGNVVRLLSAFNTPQLMVLGWSMLLSTVLYVAALAGMVVLVRGRRWFVLAFLLTVVAYFVLLSAGAEANSRFRIPILPATTMLGAFAGERLLFSRFLVPGEPRRP